MNSPEVGDSSSGHHLTHQVYRKRFSDEEQRSKDLLWHVIAAHLQRWVDPEAPVLDVACDEGHFIRNIRGSERWAVDLRDVSATLSPDVHFSQCDGVDVGAVVPHGHFGTVFMSNYLEHLPSADAVVAQIRAVRPLLTASGRLVILQPNIRYTKAAYWDFIDHRTPLTEHSLVEACDIAGFRTEHLIPRFLPYTTKSRLPQRAWMVSAYLRFPLAWHVLGQQTLYVGRLAGT